MDFAGFFMMQNIHHWIYKSIVDYFFQIPIRLSQKNIIDIKDFHRLNVWQNRFNFILKL